MNTGQHIIKFTRLPKIQDYVTYTQDKIRGNFHAIENQAWTMDIESGLKIMLKENMLKEI